MTVYERFLKYVSYPTTSDENNECCPSTEGQRVLANELVKELLELGLSDARVDENGYVYAILPASEGGDCEASTPVLAESPLGYHPCNVGFLTVCRDPASGQCQVGSLTGAVAS